MGKMYYKQLGYDFDPPFYSSASVPVITNYDRLIRKSPEEMAEKIGESIDCEVCKTMHHSESGECPCRPHQSCVDYWLDWLRQEVKDA